MNSFDFIMNLNRVPNAQHNVKKLRQRQLEWEDRNRDIITTWVSKRLKKFQLNAAETPASTSGRLCIFLDRTDASKSSSILLDWGRLYSIVHASFTE
jgi:hypothetical protein